MQFIFAALLGYGAYRVAKHIFKKKQQDVFAWLCDGCGALVNATDDEMYSRMVSCPHCGGAMKKMTGHVLSLGDGIAPQINVRNMYFPEKKTSYDMTKLLKDPFWEIEEIL